MRGLRNGRQAAWPPAGPGSRSAVCGPAGDVAVAQAAVALRRAGVPGAEVERDVRMCPRASLTDRARREECRLVGADGLDVEGGRGGSGRGLGHRDARGP